MHRFFKYLHLWLSIPVGLVVSVICFSGAALVFEQEILELCRRDLYFVETVGESTLSPSELIPIVERQLPPGRHIGSIRYSNDPQRTCRLGMEGVRHTALFADPYTGEIKGETDRSRGFFPTVLKLHRRLMGRFNAGESPASPGRKIVGIATILLPVILISGIAIWLPRNRKMLKTRLGIRFDRGRHRLWYDLHVSAGFYLVPMLLLLALTGLTWAFGWYRTGMYRLFGTDGPREATLREASRQSQERDGAGADYLSWDKALQEIRTRYPDYREITVRQNRIDVSTARYGNTRATDRISFDPRTGAVTELLPYEDQSRKTRIDGWIYTLHVGRWGGLFSKIITFLAALSGGTLPLTGYYLWLRRLRRQ